LSPCCLSLAAGSTRNGARRVSQTEFGGAFVTKPNEDVWSVRPKERTHLPGNFHRIVNAQSLQSLNVKCAIVKLALSSFVAVNTLPLAKHLFRHDESPHSSASRENTKPLLRASGILLLKV
jgi:hypothetical protein